MHVQYSIIDAFAKYGFHFGTSLIIARGNGKPEFACHVN